MENHFIKNVEFKNFKCFKDLKVKNLKMVNLISGKNNVGKTSFMEGLEMIVKPKSAFGLRMVSSDILRRRQDKKSNPNQPQPFVEFELDFFNDLKSDIHLSSKYFNSKFKFINAGEVVNQSNNIQIFNINPQIQQFIQNANVQKTVPIPFLNISCSNDNLTTSVKDFTSAIFAMPQDINHIAHNVNFISSCTTDESVIANYYGNLMSINKEQFLYESLKKFDENMISLKAIPKVFGSVLKIQLQDKELPVLLSSLGEGINRYVAILCAIWASKDGYLFIDEIENGIHYTNYEKLWEIIFEASQMANCQIFATSHSKECIEAFNEMNQKDEGIYLEFYKNQKNGLITVKERDNEQLEYALTHNREVRGE